MVLIYPTARTLFILRDSTPAWIATRYFTEIYNFFCCFLTTSSTTFFCHHDFTRCRPYSRDLRDRAGHLNGPHFRPRCLWFFFFVGHKCASCSHVVFIRFRLFWLFVSLVQPIWQLGCRLQPIWQLGVLLHCSPLAVHSTSTD